MQYHLTKVYTAGQENMIKNLGDRIWEELCDTIPADAIFTRKTVARLIEQNFGYAEKTSQLYASALIANLVEMPEGGIKKVCTGKYRFHGPEDDK